MHTSIIERRNERTDVESSEDVSYILRLNILAMYSWSLLQPNFLQRLSQSSIQHYYVSSHSPSLWASVHSPVFRQIRPSPGVNWFECPCSSLQFYAIPSTSFANSLQSRKVWKRKPASLDTDSYNRQFLVFIATPLNSGSLKSWANIPDGYIVWVVLMFRLRLWHGCEKDDLDLFLSADLCRTASPITS